MALKSLDPTLVLHASRGTLVEVPLPVLLYAILQGKRTCELELKYQAMEKRIFFENGAPIACTSNLVQETLGRYLVEKGVLSEARSQELLAISARRGRKLGEVLVKANVLDEAQLAKHLQNNLGRRILDSFLWASAHYQLVGVATLPDTAIKMQPLQLIYVGVCTTLPIEVVRVYFSHPESQRFALVQRPPREWAELKLGAKDEKLAAALASRPTIRQLCGEIGASEEEVARRLYAWSVLGFIDLAEHVSDQLPALEAEPPVVAAAPPVIAAPSADAAPFDDALGGPQRSPTRWLVGAAVVLALGVGAFLARGLFQTPEPMVAHPLPLPLPPPLAAVEPMPPVRRSPQQPPLPPPPALPAATGRTVAPPRDLVLSASGIVLEPPKRPDRASLGTAAVAKGLKLLLQQKNAQALDSFSRAVAEAPSDSECHYALALTLFELGRDGEALVAANDALELDPAHAMANLLAGFLELRSGHTARSRARFEAYLSGGALSYGPEVQSIISQLPASAP